MIAPTEKIPSTPSSSPDLTPRLRASRAVRALLLGLSLATPACEGADERVKPPEIDQQADEPQKTLLYLEKLRSYSGEDELGPLLAEMDEAFSDANLEREYEGEVDKLIVSAHLKRANNLVSRFVSYFEPSPNFHLLEAANEHLLQASEISGRSFSYEDFGFSRDELEGGYIIPFFKNNIEGCFSVMRKFAQGKSSFGGFYHCSKEARNNYYKAITVLKKKLPLKEAHLLNEMILELLIEGAQVRLEQKHPLTKNQETFCRYILLARGEIQLNDVLPVLEKLEPKKLLDEDGLVLP